MERPRVQRNTCGIAILAGIITLAFPLYGQRDTGPAGATQDDVASLQRARDFFKANRLDNAERICESLVGKGGTVAAEAQALLDQVKSRRVCEQETQRALPLSTGGDCGQLMDLLQDIQRRCPDYYSGLGFLVRPAQARCASSPAPPPALDEGVMLLNKGDYLKALDFFETRQSTNPNSPELQTWIQKAKEKLEAQKQTEQLVRNIEASLWRSDPGHAKEQLTRLEKVAPQDEHIPRLRAKLQTLLGTRQTRQEEDRASTQGALLKDAIREFYAGHFPNADQLLEQYVGGPGDHKALAYFYRGAIVCTDYFLTGAKDQQKQVRAREFFSKARQADGRFAPPRDWISPKIIEMYEKTAAGS